MLKPKARQKKTQLVVKETNRVKKVAVAKPTMAKMPLLLACLCWLTMALPLTTPLQAVSDYIQNMIRSDHVDSLILQEIQASKEYCVRFIRRLGKNWTGDA